MKIILNTATLLSLLCLALPLRADEKAKAAAMTLGKKKYVSCATCHGADGKGIEVSPGMTIASNLQESAIVQGDAEWMSLLVMKGILKQDNRFLTVKTALETSFTDEELAAIFTYLRNTWGDQNGITTAEEVAGWRKKYADIKKPLTRAEFQKRIKAASE